MSEIREATSCIYTKQELDAAREEGRREGEKIGREKGMQEAAGICDKEGAKWAARVLHGYERVCGDCATAILAAMEAK